MYLFLELEKIIIEYAGARSYKEMMKIDSKNYPKEKYYIILRNFNILVANQLELEYNSKITGSSGNDNIKLMIITALKILDILEELEIIQYERKVNIIHNKIQGSAYMSFKIKFLLDLYNSEDILFSGNFGFSDPGNFTDQFLFIKPSNLDIFNTNDNLIFCKTLNDDTTGDIFIDFSLNKPEGLWLLLAKIMNNHGSERK